MINLVETQALSPAVNPLSIIDRIIADLELTPTQYENAVKSYQAVADVLKELHPTWEIAIFPQGSMRLGTTVRPMQGERFDLDMICRIGLSGKLYTPEKVFNFVWDALGHNETYRMMRSKKNRCIRIEYADGRKFYLDVTPAVPDWAGSKALYIPDRERKIWCSTHPLGFCDDWFKPIGKLLPNIVVTMRAKNRTPMVLANEAYIESMPQHGEFEKNPLQRIVQMLKRDRDIHFEKDPNHRPSSILLTTITTRSYESMAHEPVEGLLEFVVRVVAKLPEYIYITHTPAGQKFTVQNPVNILENFAENWTHEHYARFMVWHKRALTGLQAVQGSKGLGADVMINRLSASFGNDSVLKAARALGADTKALHETGKLRVVGGLTGAAGIKVPGTINFGK